ncbi:efflux RND transporter periplasmic adaptor subunit [Thermosulfurimonas dismutans]|uniref:Cobalt/zinc/cadmium efflux RND transporter, membrane fusion protein, CzcB family n=1 Tax=Thermosulfurimonas dismutans TaxID=999894 RepID=A0A179D6R7_9BACT|nr:efflux RND transporter periplasmic adaptor subunit [Thermosulfurimonas dismutans]OAQ21481.1 Cobalt/zinc/cadmium efflux RND transporter, membrane fusion protein, CzcB family [Thermosulfurimonas dismutans]
MIAKILGIVLLLLGFLVLPVLGKTPKDDHSHEDEKVIKLSEKIIREFGIHIEKATLRVFPRIVELPGEITADPDREVHVVPVARGFVREVYKRWGDRVCAGEVLAVIDSPELADLKASYLAAKARLRLAEELYRREELLWKKKITAGESFLKAKKDLELARIEVKTLEQKLLTLGFSPEEIKEFESGRRPLGRYELRSPISGLVVEKHLVRGEMVGPDRLAFQIADLSVVWVLISVYREWLPYVGEGQRVWLVIGEKFPEIEARIDYLNPILDPDTRSAKARVILKNLSRELKPGLLVKVRVAVGGEEKALVVPEGAIQYLKGHPAVFVKTEEGFVPREVKIGRKHGKWVEITAGLAPGETYVAKGALTLKAELEKESLGHGHVH